jgi:hypothetical protein
MEKLQWFKFSYADWRMGKIQRCSEITQARFINLCCLYWSKDAVLTYEDAEIEIEKEHLDILIGKKIIKLEDCLIKIEFLDEQIENIAETSNKRRDAVLKRWKKVKQNDTSVLQNDTSVLQNDTEESRVEKSREEKMLELKVEFQNSPTSEVMKKNLCSLHHMTEQQLLFRMKNFWLENSHAFPEDKTIHDVRNHFSKWLKIDLTKNPLHRINQ